MRGGDPENIVSMLGRNSEKLRAPLTMVERYWQSLLNGRQIPCRSDIDPRGIQDALDYAMICEQMSESTAKIRVSGTHLNDLGGMSLAGMPLGVMFAHDARPHLSKAVRSLFTSPAIVRMELFTAPTVWAEQMTGEIVMMPLRSDFGDVNRALCCMVTRGKIGRAPRRFCISNMTVTSLAGASETEEFRVPPPPRVREAPRPVPSEAPRAPLRPESGAPHLRLVVSND